MAEKFDKAIESIKKHEGSVNHVYKVKGDRYTTGYGNTYLSFHPGRTEFSLYHPRTGEEKVLSTQKDFDDFNRGKYYKWKLTDADKEAILYGAVPDYQDSAMKYRGDIYPLLGDTQQQMAVDAYYNGNDLGNKVVDELYDFNVNDSKMPSWTELKAWTDNRYPNKSEQFRKAWTNRIHDDILNGRKGIISIEDIFLTPEE